uniref:Uncharacterized protein n=1 Tax=Physcomitrium patens TaxID=3218 RepID=A0A7I4FMU1_PHYPA
MDGNGSINGCPLGQPEIHAKYNALLQRDTKRKLAKANLRNQDTLARALPLFPLCNLPLVCHLEYINAEMMLVENFDESGSKIFTSKISFSKQRDRWTSHELFGSLDIKGELDIMGTIAEGRNVTYSEHVEIPDPKSDKFHHYSLEDLNYSLEKINIPSSDSNLDSYSPCQFTSDSKGWVINHDQHILRGRGEQRDVKTRRMKVTSPSSLFRDGPCYTFEKPYRDQSPTNIHKRLKRKLAQTSFNKRQKQHAPMHPQL